MKKEAEMSSETLINFYWTFQKNYFSTVTEVDCILMQIIAGGLHCIGRVRSC
jgi:hypothetical protein